MLKSLVEFHFMAKQIDERRDKGWKNVSLDPPFTNLTYVEQFVSKLWVAPVILGATLGYPF